MTAPSPFSTTTPNFQTTWDSTSLGWLKECARLYQYQMLGHYQSKSKGIHLVFGGLYASALERYHHARASGEDHLPAVLRMVRWALENSGERDEEGVWHPWTPAPDDPNANIKNRFTLIRSLVWNVEDLRGSFFSTLILSNGKPAVELSFNFHAFDLDGEAISLSGHLDRVVHGDGQLFITDDKTTKNAITPSYFKQYTPHNQMSLYSHAGRVVLAVPIRGVLIRATQIGVNFNRFATAPVHRPEAVLDEWMDDTKFYIAQAKRFAAANYWPMNDKSCGNYGGCPFQRVCAVSPTHRPAWLQQDFILRTWNPLDSRGSI